MPRLLVVYGLLLLLSPLAWGQPSQAPPRDAAPTPAVRTQAAARGPSDAERCQAYLHTAGGIPPNNVSLPLCDNTRGVAGVITLVTCMTRQGTLVFQPRLSGGEATSILARPLLCTPEGAVGVLNGQPRLQSFAKGTRTCVGACTLEFHVQAVDGAEEAILTVVYEYE